MLKPGGVLHFLEHGRSPDERGTPLAAPVDPVQSRLAGGCHLDRPIETLISDAGFEITDGSRVRRRAALVQLPLPRAGASRVRR